MMWNQRVLLIVLLWVSCALIVSKIPIAQGAFQVSTKLHCDCVTSRIPSRTTSAFGGTTMQRQQQEQQEQQQRQQEETLMTLMMVPKNKSGNKNEDEVIKQKWDFSLFLTYMTPWINPNSVFVYLFLTLYALGKYSEAHRVVNSGL